MTGFPPSESAVNVFVTGQPGIGKTSLVLKVAQKLPPGQVAGFFTVEAVAEGTGEKLGLDVVTLSGERAPLCRLRRGCGPKIGKYYVAIEEFERVVLPHLTPNENIKLHIIDEVGRMALCSKRFSDAVITLLSSPQAAVFGSLPAPRYGHPLPLVEEIKQRSDTAVLTLTKANRDATAQHLEELLTRLLADETPASNSVPTGGHPGACDNQISGFASNYNGSSTYTPSSHTPNPTPTHTYTNTHTPTPTHMRTSTLDTDPTNMNYGNAMFNESNYNYSFGVGGGSHAHGGDSSAGSQGSADFPTNQMQKSASSDSFGEVYQFTNVPPFVEAGGVSPSDLFFPQNNNFYQNGDVFYNNDFDPNFQPFNR